MHFATLLQLDDGCFKTARFDRFELNDYNPVSERRKHRALYKPNRAMRVIHKRFIQWLRNQRVFLPSSTCGQKDQSPKRNIERHRWNRYFYLLDIANAYQNVDVDRLVHMVCQLDPALDRSTSHHFLQQHFFLPGGGLVTGGPASPDLFNLYGEHVIDRPLRELCHQYGLRYTRYLDDMTFSASSPIGARKRCALCSCVRATGLPLNEHKTQYVDTHKKAVVITGVGIARGGRLFLPRGFLRRVRGLIHRAIKDPAIPPARVHGMMSVFWAVRKKHDHLNQTERKLVRLYRTYQRINANQL